MNKSISDSLNRYGVITTLRLMGFSRSAIGLYFLAFPEDSSQRLLVDSRGTGEAMTFGRLAAGRDLAIGVGTLMSSWSDSGAEHAWVVAGLIADSVDVYAFIRDDSLTGISRIVSAGVALGAVGLGAWTLKNIGALTPDDDEGTHDSNDD
jgi:hypothetical protein